MAGVWVGALAHVRSGVVGLGVVGVCLTAGVGPGAAGEAHAHGPAQAAASVTPTGTVVSQITVRLTLQRSAAAPSAGHVTGAFFRVYPGGSTHGSRTALQSVSTQTDNSGAFIEQLNGLDGTYDFVVKPSGALSRELNNVSVPRNTNPTLVYGTFEEGDVNGDDLVNAADVTLLKATFGKAAGQQGYDSRADFNRDGRVTLLDISLLSRAYGLSGPRQEP